MILMEPVPHHHLFKWITWETLIDEILDFFAPFCPILTHNV